MRAIVLALALLGCHSADECERGLARLGRIAKAKGQHPLASKWTPDVIERCRKDAHYDPVLGCAIDASSDEAADACIDAFFKAVVKPGATDGSGHVTDGSGLNPLLDP